MRFSLPYHGLEFEIPDNWWIEAGMAGFQRQSKAYPSMPHPAWPNRPVILASIHGIELGPELWCRVANPKFDCDGLYRDRLLRIFRGFVEGRSLPPVEVCDVPEPGSFRYRLHD